MTDDQLKNLFQKYLNRDPLPYEYTLHRWNDHDAFEITLSTCEERRAINNNAGIKVAILLSGHIRKNHILDSLIQNFSKYKTDIFIHTWDNLGIKGSEMNLNADKELESVNNEIAKFPNVVKYEIENNAEYIESIKDEDIDIIYFNYSSPEKFIKSQLYSINKCWNLFEEQIRGFNPNYDIVIRARFDIEFGEVKIGPHLISEINNHDLIFFPNADSPHPHLDYGTSCQACDIMYNNLGMKYPHIFDHSNVVCDIFAYGSVSSMKKYCSLYNHYDEIAKEFEQKNLKSMNRQRNPGVSYNGKDYDIQGDLDAHYYYYGSFPERMLSHYLKDYLLVESKQIKLTPDTLR